ncbi:MAG: Ig-like domain repeat protein, partial [Xanthomonadales bacterium]|nr:Ig-like domain repeat protein [Xanthomonadales bacterium]
VLQASTTTALTAAPVPAIVGMPVQLTATVSQPGSSGVVLGGAVDFLEGALPIPGCSAVPVVSGVAICNTSFSPAGVRTLVANYLGDNNNLPSSDSLQLMVNRVPTTTTLTVLPDSVPINGVVNLSVLVEGGVPPLSGTVSITANGFPIPECQNLTLVGGMASCQFIALEANEFLLVATYSGDVDDDSSSGTASLTVFALSIPVGGPWVVMLLVLLMMALARRAIRQL